MNGSLEANRELVSALVSGLGALSQSLDVIVCPPTIYIPSVLEATKDTSISVGAQDVSAESAGAFTGEISAGMLADSGCRFGIVGHSERRTLHQEDDRLVARKVSALLDHQVTPIFCVGETLADREAGRTLEIIRAQVGAVLDKVGIVAFTKMVIAYEPVWAIGTGRTASPEQAQEIHAFIRGLLADHSKGVAADIPILYGGSVNASNALALFSQEDIDGGLIGGASLKAEEFLKICVVG